MYISKEEFEYEKEFEREIQEFEDEFPTDYNYRAKKNKGVSIDKFLNSTFG